MTKAEKWVERIDGRNEVTATDINRRCVRRMKEAAVDVIQDGSPRLTDLYVFSDHSGLYEKRKDDWYPLNAEDVKSASD